MRVIAVLVFFLFLLTGIRPDPVSADVIRIAVASNFSGAMKTLVTRFEAQSDHRVTLVFGSTGKHYAQIRNGAPFDIFFAGDTRRPELLEKDDACVPGSRFTYALGRVVLWSPSAGYVDPDGNILNGDFRHLSIANPNLAPYGRAARDVLEARGLWDEMKGRIVRGENVGQAFHFVMSGNAELGFVAYSQIKRPGAPTAGSYWEVPTSMYRPIEQQAVLLGEGTAARAFLEFARSDDAREIILGYGYDLPQKR